MGAVAESDPEVEWQRFNAVTEQLQQHSSPRVDVAAVQSALKHLQSPQQLCCLLGLQPVDPDADADGVDASGSEPDADWPERAATVAALVQQVLGLLLSDQQASRASVHQGIRQLRCGISPSRHTIRHTSIISQMCVRALTRSAAAWACRRLRCSCWIWRPAAQRRRQTSPPQWSRRA